jgi:hypothetical protein
VALSGLGGLAGILIGAAATVGYATYQGWPPVIPLTAVLGGLAGALLIGMVAGVYPSIRAAPHPDRSPGRPLRALARYPDHPSRAASFPDE